ATSLERFLGFATETDDEVTADSHTWDTLATSREHLTIVGHGVKSLHALQHLVAARLDRDMQIGTDLRQLPDGIEQVVAHISREVGDELDTHDARRVVNARQQVGESNLPAVAQVILVTIHCLPEQRYFLAAGRGKLADLGRNVIWLAALLGTSHP